MERGFTLIELLIVIGILAILSTGTVLLINPAEKLREVRDVQRINDLTTLRDGLILYLSRAANVDLDTNNPPNGTCGADWWSSSGSSFVSPLSDARPLEPFFLQSGTVTGEAAQNASSRAIDGTGWVPVDFRNLVGNTSPFSTLPVDSTPDVSAALDATGHYYAYACDNSAKTFELNANMESVKYASGGSKDVESKDGGARACSGIGSLRCVTVDPFVSTKADLIYEVGNDPGLDL